MFDSTLHNQTMAAVDHLFRQNGHVLGQQFCTSFMYEYTPNNANRQTYENANALQQYVINKGRQISPNGQLNNEQFFAVVWSYIEDVYKNTIARYSQPQGFSNPSSYQSPFNGGSMFGGNSFQPSFSSPFSGQSGGNTPVVQPISPVPVVETIKSSTTVNSFEHNFKRSPLDDISVSDDTVFSEVNASDCWAGEAPRDHVFVVKNSSDLKAHGVSLVMRHATSQSRLIFDNDFDVTKRFFKTAPDSILSKYLIFEIFYDHLEVINVATQELSEIIVKLKEALTSRRGSDPFYKIVIDTCSTLRRGAWKALSAYLVNHINRALYLSCRISSDPSLKIRIAELEDINELLSSTFSSPLTAIPDGRNKMKQIVEYTIANALWFNSHLLFGVPGEDDWDWALDVMKTCSVFPDSINNVYPSKRYIPNTKKDKDFDIFRKAFEEHELSTSSYILSRRSVVITNVLSGDILSRLNKNPYKASGAVASLFRQFSVDHLRESGSIYNPRNFNQYKEPAEKMDLSDYYSNPSHDDRDIEADFVVSYEGSRFVDRSNYAIEFQGNPQDYLTSFDVISFMDILPSEETGVTLIKRDVDVLTVK